MVLAVTLGRRIMGHHCRYTTYRHLVERLVMIVKANFIYCLVFPNTELSSFRWDKVVDSTGKSSHHVTDI